MRCLPVILAGGFGKRLYPLSYDNKPKQFMNILNNNISIFQNTLQRIRNIFQNDPIIILCNKKSVDLIQEQISFFQEKNYILVIEEECRNTFASLLLVLKIIEKTKLSHTYNSIFVSPSDSYFVDYTFNLKNDFTESIKESDKTNKHIIFGTKIENINTNYGYIHISSNIQNTNFFKVRKFFEKPNHKKIKSFIKKNNYLWNIGCFVFNTNQLLKDVKKYMEEDYKIYSTMDIVKYYGNKNIFITDNGFLKLTKTSIDKGIIEKIHNYLCCKINAEWYDIGSFETISILLQNHKIKLSNKNYFETNFAKNLLIAKSIL